MFNTFNVSLSLVVIILLVGIFLLGMNRKVDNRNPERTDIPEADTIVIDFNTCQPTKARVWVDFGSTTYQIVGRTNDVCTMKYGNEIENPNWDGVLRNICRVPISLGKMDFTKTARGLDFSSIQKFCSE